MLLTTAPVLQNPDMSKPFLLWSDASEAVFGSSHHYHTQLSYVHNIVDCRPPRKRFGTFLLTGGMTYLMKLPQLLHFI